MAGDLNINKKLKIKSPWTGIEELENFLIGFEVGSEYKYQFTSMDRLIELQEIFCLIKNHLEECHFEDEKKFELLKKELGIFRGFLSEVK